MAAVSVHDHPTAQIERVWVALARRKPAARAWDENADPFTKTVQVTISRLRRKLGDPELIQTIPGVGYRITGLLDEEDDAGDEG
jgi:DNA-binding response OmpR family regulator